MMAKRVSRFVEGLISKTREGKLDWQAFSSFSNKREIFDELEMGRGGFDYLVNSIRESKSYFLQSGDGILFLFAVYHGDPEMASPVDDTMVLMMKINNVLPLESLLDYTESMEEKLERLRLLIENYLEQKYSYPDVLYQFMDQILADED